MEIPEYISEALNEFGRATGLQGLRLAENGAASLSFENGVALRFEYAFETLTVLATVPLAGETSGKLVSALTAAHPEARHGFKLRVAFLAKSNRLVFAARIPEREVSRQSLETVFQELWSLAVNHL